MECHGPPQLEIPAYVQSKRAATAHNGGGAAPPEYEHHAAHDIVLSSSGDRGVHKGGGGCRGAQAAGVGRGG